MPNPSEPPAAKLNWWTIVKVGLITGFLFILIPLGSPWSALGLASGAVMGRSPTVYGAAQAFTNIPIHLLLALLYTVVIAIVARRLRTWRGILAGGVVGLVLYVLNLVVVRLAFPDYAGMEDRVAFTHVAFGIFAAALYKGMTRAQVQQSVVNP